MLRVSGITRSILEQKGYKMLAQMEKQSLTSVFINIMDYKSWKLRLADALTETTKVLTAGSVIKLNERIYFSVGEMTHCIDKLGESRKCARDTLYLQNIFGNPTVLFYDDLNVYRIIMSLEKTALHIKTVRISKNKNH